MHSPLFTRSFARPHLPKWKQTVKKSSRLIIQGWHGLESSGEALDMLSRQSNKVMCKAAQGMGVHRKRLAYVHSKLPRRPGRRRISGQPGVHSGRRRWGSPPAGHASWDTRSGRTRC